MRYPSKRFGHVWTNQFCQWSRSSGSFYNLQCGELTLTAGILRSLRAASLLKSYEKHVKNIRFFGITPWVKNTLLVQVRWLSFRLSSAAGRKFPVFPFRPCRRFCELCLFLACSSWAEPSGWGANVLCDLFGRCLLADECAAGWQQLGTGRGFVLDNTEQKYCLVNRGFLQMNDDNPN